MGPGANRRKNKNFNTPRQGTRRSARLAAIQGSVEKTLYQSYFDDIRDLVESTVTQNFTSSPTSNIQTMTSGDSHPLVDNNQNSEETRNLDENWNLEENAFIKHVKLFY